MPLTTGVIDAATPYKLFQRAGYTGPVVCEPLHPTMELYQTYTKERCVREFAEAYARLEKQGSGKTAF